MDHIAVEKKTAPLLSVESLFLALQCGFYALDFFG